MEMTLEQENRLRQAFKGLNHFMVLVWRLGLGSYGNGHRWLGAYMVILHKGRKSGREYRTPVNYTEIEGEIFCTAGFGSKSDWYQNIMADPEVELWLPDGRWRALATDVTEVEDRREIMRRVLIASGFAGPLFGVDPRKMSPPDFDQILEQYRLVRFTRSEPVTGSGGPGDLNWIWPVLALALAGLLMLRPRRR